MALLRCRLMINQESYIIHVAVDMLRPSYYSSGVFLIISRVVLLLCENNFIGDVFIRYCGSAGKARDVMKNINNVEFIFCLYFIPCAYP